MELRNITSDTQTHYRLEVNEQVVFFLLNRSGDITFELAGERAEAHVFAFFLGTGETKSNLTLSQRHLAPRTTSRVLVKSVLKDQAEFSYRGTLFIAPHAILSDAAQENRNLLLSKEAKAFSEPFLEILNNDVRCHHAATTSPLNKEALFYAKSRGLSENQSERLLIDGFLRSSFETMGALISSQESEQILKLVLHANVR